MCRYRQYDAQITQHMLVRTHVRKLARTYMCTYVRDAWRHARTTTTLSWSDGTLGRAFVTAPSKVLPGPQAQRMPTHVHTFTYVPVCMGTPYVRSKVRMYVRR